MSAIIWADPSKLLPPVNFERDLKVQLKGRVDAAYVFGSYGTPDFGPGSDVDLILIVDTELPFVERPRSFEDLYDLYPRLDLLVYSAEEFDRLLSEPVGFWASVRSSLRVLDLETSDSN